MKKKIGLFLGSRPCDGGVFQYNQSILEAVVSLPTESYDTVVAYKDKLWENYLQEYDIKNIYIPWGLPVRVLGRVSRYLGLSPMRIWRNAVHYYHPVIQTILAQKSDLWIFPSQDLISYQIQVPALVTILDLMHRYESKFPEVCENGQFELRERLFKNISYWSKGILVDSNVGKEHVEKSYNVDPQKIYELPYIPPKYVFLKKDVIEFEKRYKIPHKFIFYPAQFWRHKNHKNLLKAAALLKTQFPDLHFVFVGSIKNGYNEVCSLIQELHLIKNVSIFHYVPNEDVIEFYRRATALVMPTFFGPTNIPPIEAFALGCPVAVSNVYGMPEQVGDAGLLFNPNNVDEIANVCEILWIDHKKRKELIKRGFAKSKEWNQQKFNFKFKSIVETVLQQ